MVNTFVTSTCLKECAANLDYRRLGKQRVEAMQLINVLEALEAGKEPKGWRNHPATKMWLGKIGPLKVYFNHMVREWVERGYKNTMELYDVKEDEYKVVPCKFDGTKAVYAAELTDKTFPWWFSFEPFIYAHRAALYRKDPAYYADFLKDPKLKPYLYRGYIWPFEQEQMRHDFNLSYHAEVQVGAPAQYRINKALAEEWATKKSVNPTTGRKMSKGSETYKEFAAAHQHYVDIGEL